MSLEMRNRRTGDSDYGAGCRQAQTRQVRYQDYPTPGRKLVCRQSTCVPAETRAFTDSLDDWASPEFVLRLAGADTGDGRGLARDQA
jgi:hypothetical protein